MKKTILLTILLVLSQLSYAQHDALDKFMGHYKGKDGVMKMSFNANFNFGGNDELKGFNFKSASSKVKGVRLFILDEKANVLTSDFQTLINDMKRTHFDDLLTIRKGGERVHFMGRETNKGYTDLTFLVKDEKGSAFLMCLEGVFTKHDVDKIMENSK